MKLLHNGKRKKCLGDSSGFLSDELWRDFIPRRVLEYTYISFARVLLARKALRRCVCLSRSLDAESFCHDELARLMYRIQGRMTFLSELKFDGSNSDNRSRTLFLLHHQQHQALPSMAIRELQPLLLSLASTRKDKSYVPSQLRIKPTRRFIRKHNMNTA